MSPLLTATLLLLVVIAWCVAGLWHSGQQLVALVEARLGDEHAWLLRRVYDRVGIELWGSLELTVEEDGRILFVARFVGQLLVWPTLWPMTADLYATMIDSAIRYVLMEVEGEAAIGRVERYDELVLVVVWLEVAPMRLERLWCWVDEEDGDGWGRGWVATGAHRDAPVEWVVDSERIEWVEAVRGALPRRRDGTHYPVGDWT